MALCRINRLHCRHHRRRNTTILVKEPPALLLLSCFNLVFPPCISLPFFIDNTPALKRYASSKKASIELQFFSLSPQFFTHPFCFDFFFPILSNVSKEGKHSLSKGRRSQKSSSSWAEARPLGWAQGESANPSQILTADDVQQLKQG